jgi:hypothetical protein
MANCPRRRSNTATLALGYPGRSHRSGQNPMVGSSIDIVEGG